MEQLIYHGGEKMFFFNMKGVRMETYLVQMLFGHLVGDFVLQHREMANNKFLPGRKGALWCSLHVLVYTLTLGAFVGNFSLIFLLFVYIPHWVMDRYSLAYQWMRLIGRGELMKSMKPLDASFGAIIYVVIDQTAHIGCLFLLLSFIEKG